MFPTAWKTQSFTLQFTERAELSIFLTNPVRNPKDALKFLNCVDFVVQRTKNTLNQISINEVRRGKNGVQRSVALETAF